MKIIKAIKKIIYKCIFFVPDYILDIWLFEFRSFLGRTFTGNLKLDQRRQKVTPRFADVLSELVPKAK